MKTAKLSFFTASFLLAAAVQAAPGYNNVITEAELQAAQQAWGEALISISQAYQQGGRDQATSRAREVLERVVVLPPLNGTYQPGARGAGCGLWL